MGFMDWLRGKRYDHDFDAPEPAPPLPPARVAPPPPRYSITNAVELMRALPYDENPELVLRVLRKTLRSTGVSVEEIVESAKARERALSTDASEQRAAIEQLEQQIVARRTNIERLESDLQETKSVRERLEQAMENETRIAPLPSEVRMEVAAIRSASAAPPPVAPASHAPPVPKSSAPPVVKSTAPPLPRKPLGAKPSAPKPTTEPREDATSIPNLSVDDGPEESENPTRVPSSKD